MKRDELVRHLDSKKIGTRLLFAGNLLKQPYMLGKTYRLPDSVPNSDVVMNSTLWLGLYPGLSTAHLDYMVEEIKNFYKN